MAVNLVSSPTMTTTTVQQQTTKVAKRSRTGNAKFPAGTGGLELKDLVAVLPDIIGKAKPHHSSAICNPRVVIPDCGSGASGTGGGELHLAIASLNAASKEFSTLAEKVMAIAATTNNSSSSNHSGETGQQDCQLINDSNNTTVNEKEKTEHHIYKEIDDITLADSKAPSPVPWSAAFQHQTRPVATPTADTGNVVVAIDNPCTPARKPTSARNEVIVKDCTAIATIPRGLQLAVPPPRPVLAPPPLEEKLDKLLDSVVKIKVDMHQKIDRIARRVDQIRQDVQLNIDNTDRSVCNNLLELAGVPYQKGENLQLYFRRICELLGYAEADIPLVDIRRKRADRTEKTESSINTATTNPNLKGTVAAADQAEPPVITIEFIFKNIRDAFYRAYLRSRATPIRLTDIGLESDRRIYINESLTKLNQKLKSAALRKKRDGLLHAVYTVDGAVFVQAQPGQKGRRVCSLAELE